MNRASAGVLDTSTQILIERVDPDELPDEPVITAVTLAELSVGPLVTDDPLERVARQQHLQLVEASYEPLPFGVAEARVFGHVAAMLCRSGPKPAPRAFDALIAATALANGLPVYTCNPADFAGIDGLDVRSVTRPAGDAPE